MNDICNLSLSAVIPVAAATMTPLPLLAVLCVMKFREYLDKRNNIPVGSKPICCHTSVPTVDGELDEDVKHNESSQKLVTQMEKIDANSNGAV
jgi:hypothetical protein